MTRLALRLAVLTTTAVTACSPAAPTPAPTTPSTPATSAPSTASPQPAAAPPHMTMLWTAVGQWGVQPAGEDAGQVFAFVRLASAQPARWHVDAIELVRDGLPCATSTLPEVDLVSNVDEHTASREMTVTALAHRAPLAGELPSGTFVVRVRANIDHGCGGIGAAPMVVVRARASDTGDALVATGPIVERLPS